MITLCLCATTNGPDQFDYRNLRSYIQLIDRYVILDSGLTNDDRILIKSNLSPVKGIFVNYKFENDFAKMRNTCIGYVKSGFIIMPDDTWSICQISRSDIVAIMNKGYDSIICRMDTQNSYNNVERIFRYSCRFDKPVREILINNPRRIKHARALMTDNKVNKERSLGREQIDPLYQGYREHQLDHVDKALEYWQEGFEKESGETKYMCGLQIALHTEQEEDFLRLIPIAGGRIGEVYWYLDKLTDNYCTELERVRLKTHYGHTLQFSYPMLKEIVEYFESYNDEWSDILYNV